MLLTPAFLSTFVRAEHTVGVQCTFGERVEGSLVCPGEGGGGSCFLAVRTTAKLEVPPWSTDLIALVPSLRLIQRLRGAEGTVCTSIFTASQTSEPAAFPRKHNTQSFSPLL